VCPRGVTFPALLYPEKDMAPALLLASAGNTAFFVIFGVFVVAMITLAVIVIMWAVRHDLAGRQAWRARQARAGGQQRSDRPDRSDRSDRSGPPDSPGAAS
jgi:hypothetical protein